jgi:hypothetical protein
MNLKNQFNQLHFPYKLIYFLIAYGQRWADAHGLRIEEKPVGNDAILNTMID